MNWSSLGIKPATFFIPKKADHFPCWACVACDQYTSQPEYWQRVDERVEAEPSTLRMILPECFLDQAEERIPKIHQTMKDYIENGILTTCVQNGMILTARTTQSGTRIGLVLAVDLECYDYRKGAVSLIRATEKTIESRLPARMKVRRGAMLETAHVLMLCNDADHTVIEPIWQIRESLKPVYDFELMEDGGHLSGWAVDDEGTLKKIFNSLNDLRLHGGEHPFLFAVGDGNHSLASAKAYWEEKKTQLNEEECLSHPARYAMVELENIHDPALRFEPIHRVVFHCSAEALQTDFSEWLKQNKMAEEKEKSTQTQEITFVTATAEKHYHIANSPFGISVATLQNFLDEWLPAHSQSKLDYVHGTEAIKQLTQQSNTVGILLPKPDGGSLFDGVIKNGCLPRKTFSLGEANEKRFYMECRMIER